ncbi:MAG: trehalose monomycolate/heme transporter [Solirubrobacterales bacterium]|nr:trehalose monomycolate/heme transporter [Solirubrobacterales bacterium]
MFDRLARFIYARRRLVGIGAGVFFVVAVAIGGSVSKHLDPYGNDDPATQSVKADNLIEAKGFRSTSVIVLVKGGAVDSKLQRAKVERIAAELKARSDVASVHGYYDTGSRAFVSKDGRETYLAVALHPTDDRALQDASGQIDDQLSKEKGVEVGGFALANQQVNKQTESDLRRAEILVFPILFLLSLLFFRSAVAAVLPLMVGGLAIVGTFLILRIAAEFGSISIFALNLTTGLGLGLAIDYSLFIVSRYREELARRGVDSGHAEAGRTERWEALRATMRTAGRTVLFSSLTVAAALASLMVFPQRFLYSMGIGGACVAVLAAVIAIVVLPAVLSLLGPRVNAGAPRFLQHRADRDARSLHSGFWYRLSQFVMRRPVAIALSSATLLIALGIPFLSIKFTSVDAQILPTSASARQVDDALRANFPPYHDTPIEVVVDGGGSAATASVSSQLGHVAGIAAVEQPTRLAGGVSVIDAISTHPFIAGASKDTVRAIRALPDPPGSSVLVTGASAHYVDFQSSLVSHLPIALAIVIIATLLILFAMTGSVILPIKSLLMNALNLSAVFGILVLIFQNGNLEGLLGYTSQGALEETMPILLFAVAFGLSTDYAVFLLSRIKEARDGGASNRDAVATGLERTGRIVTAAAVLFSIAIGAFATSKIVFIKENGIGTALAVLIDASIIRALLVPSLMALLGKWNWWAPAPLRRLHDRWGVSESPATAPARARS